MSLVVLLLLGSGIGLVLGGLGGGGAVLTVPVLVFVVGESGTQATTSSLVVVGCAALTAVVSHSHARNVMWGPALALSAVGIPASWLGSRLGRTVSQDALLVGFSVLMVVAAVAMLRPPNGSPAACPTIANGAAEASVSPLYAVNRWWPTAVAGLGVGMLTGFFGVGGGFVIVPALVLFLELPMRAAIGTSLVVVAANSAMALAERGGSGHLDWSAIAPFTIAAMVAAPAGRHLGDRLPAAKSRVGFAALLLVVAAYTCSQGIEGVAHRGRTAVAAAALPRPLEGEMRAVAKHFPIPVLALSNP